MTCVAGTEQTAPVAGPPATAHSPPPPTKIIAAAAALGFYAIGLGAQDVACGALRGAAWSPPLESMPREWREFALELRATPAGQHILRMVREERGPAFAADAA